jgi:stearoyl-CoA desaturase (delta-9 desaturase)
MGMIWAVLWTLLTTHLLMVNTCLYLHRGLAHKAVTWSPRATWFFRVITWIDGVSTKKWVSQHRVHHLFTDVEGDPHSPQLQGIWQIAFKGFFYNLFFRYSMPHWLDQEKIEFFGKGCPDDDLERCLFIRHLRMGIFILGAIDVALFGWWGLLIWLIQASWTPLVSNSLITGMSHYPQLHNMPGWAFFIIGDEYHLDHHKRPNSAKIPLDPNNFDLGFFYIQVAEKMGLATTRKP